MKSEVPPQQCGELFFYEHLKFGKRWAHFILLSESSTPKVGPWRGVRPHRESSRGDGGFPVEAGDAGKILFQDTTSRLSVLLRGMQRAEPANASIAPEIVVGRNCPSSAQSAVTDGEKNMASMESASQSRRLRTIVEESFIASDPESVKPLPLTSGENNSILRKCAVHDQGNVSAEASPYSSRPYSSLRRCPRESNVDSQAAR